MLLQPTSQPGVNYSCAEYHFSMDIFFEILEYNLLKEVLDIICKYCHEGMWPARHLLIEKRKHKKDSYNLKKASKATVICTVNTV